MSKKKKIIQGKYNYLRDGALYSEENFSVYQEEGMQGDISFESELLSRVETGEFLKINVNYDLTYNMIPLEVKVQRILGDRESIEVYEVDQKTNMVTYKFKGEDNDGEHQKIMMGRPHFTTPSFLTSMIMTYSKKIDPMQKTHYQVVTSSNIWNYESPFVETDIYIELKSIKAVDIIIEKAELKATHCQVMQLDSDGFTTSTPHDFYLSKYFHIPYKANFGDGIQIIVENLKYFEDSYKGMF